MSRVMVFNRLNIIEVPLYAVSVNKCRSAVDVVLGTRSRFYIFKTLNASAKKVIKLWIKTARRDETRAKRISDTTNCRKSLVLATWGRGWFGKPLEQQGLDQITLCNFRLISLNSTSANHPKAAARMVIHSVAGVDP